MALGASRATVSLLEEARLGLALHLDSPPQVARLALGLLLLVVLEAVGSVQVQAPAPHLPECSALLAPLNRSLDLETKLLPSVPLLLSVELRPSLRVERLLAQDSRPFVVLVNDHLPPCLVSHSSILLTPSRLTPSPRTRPKHNPNTIPEHHQFGTVNDVCDAQRTSLKWAQKTICTFFFSLWLLNRSFPKPCRHWCAAETETSSCRPCSLCCFVGKMYMEISQTTTFLAFSVRLAETRASTLNSHESTLEFAYWTRLISWHPFACSDHLQTQL